MPMTPTRDSERQLTGSDAAEESTEVRTDSSSRGHRAGSGMKGGEEVDTACGTKQGFIIIS